MLILQMTNETEGKTNKEYKNQFDRGKTFLVRPVS